MGGEWGEGECWQREWMGGEREVPAVSRQASVEPTMEAQCTSHTFMLPSQACVLSTIQTCNKRGEIER